LIGLLGLRRLKVRNLGREKGKFGAGGRGRSLHLLEEGLDNDILWVEPLGLFKVGDCISNQIVVKGPRGW